MESACNIIKTNTADVALRKYQILAEKARDIFLFVDMDGAILEANESAVRAYGYCREEILNKTIFDLRGGDPIISEQMEQAKETGLFFETVHYRKDGSSFPVEVSTQSTIIGGKDVLLSIVRDITQRKQVEAQNREAMEFAQSAYRAKSEFLANMSHEIRTPLNGVIGMIDLTLLTVLTDEQKDNLITAKNCADSLLKIINDILDFSKIEAGKISIENIEFDLGSLAEKMMKMHVLNATEKGLMLTMALPEHLPPRIKGDPARLQQILNNLMSNALKFTEKGSVCLEVHNLGNNGNTICLQFDVMDSGIGISTEDVPKLFKSFSQVDGSHARKYGGTGLGLVISRQLAEKMGGTLNVSSEKGKGSIFSLVMGFEIAEGAEEPAMKTNFQSECNNRTKILLVEDDAVNQIVVSRMLKRLGYSFDVAGNGQECLSLLRERSYDLCLMDIQMPGMDGIQTTEAIRSMEELKGWHLPVIALTAHALLGDRERFITLGMDDYLAKPFQMSDLQESINRMLDRHPMPKASEETVETECDGTKQAAGETWAILTQLQEVEQMLEEAQDPGVIRTQAKRLRCLADKMHAERLKAMAFEIEMAVMSPNRSDLLQRIQHFRNKLSMVRTILQ